MSEKIGPGEYDYQRHFGKMVFVGASYSAPHSLTVTPNAAIEQTINSIEFSVDKIKKIIQEYQVVGVMESLFKLDLAVISLEKKWIVGIYLAVPYDDAETLLRGNKWVCDEGMMPTQVTEAEMDKFLYDRHFDTEIENILEN